MQADQAFPVPFPADEAHSGDYAFDFEGIRYLCLAMLSRAWLDILRDPAKPLATSVRKKTGYTYNGHELERNGARYSAIAWVFDLWERDDEFGFENVCRVCGYSTDDIRQLRFRFKEHLTDAELDLL